MEQFNTIPLTYLTGALCKIMDVQPPKQSEGVIDDLVDFVFDKTGGKPVDRVLMFNPDAIGQWTCQKYASKFASVREHAPLELPLLSVVPPKTPVCFGSMYTGASPSVHGILHYTKPVITIDSIFDAMIRAGKKPCIVTVKESSMSKIFNERDMDYYLEDYDEQVLAKALELIEQDKYDLICVYNQEYDDVMHRSHPNSKRSQRAIDHYSDSFDRLAKQVEKNWTNHNTLIGYAPDHGTHREWYLLGNHGKNIPADMNIFHYYGVIPSIDNKRA
ncbi:MAG: alkaline phosphatase family protein [Clostridia bacterium]|nr:alkaline phosphatase family protein [Clostridia bacterium]